MATLYAKYSHEDVHNFAGVTLDDLSKIEATFDVNVCVYKLEEISDGTTVGELVRRSPCQYIETMYLNLSETHFSYIRDIKVYSHSYKCSKCGESLWKYPYLLKRHELTCEGGIRRVHKGGVYHTTPSIFQRLDDEGIVVEKTLRYYPYRATFDFECFFTGNNLPANTKTLQWSARHVPLSVSVASNVPGYEPAQCNVTDGDSDKLVANMMDHLIAISDAAFGALVPLYADVLDELDTQKYAWEEVEAKAQKKGKEINPYEKLIQQLCSWLHQLPVIGFNSGHYDLNAIKIFFVPLLIRSSAAERASCFVIKKQNNFMCLTTDKFKFVEICNYLAPGFSYAKYLAAYGCAQQKGHFPYEYMDDLRKLDDQALPTQTAFFSQLKNEGISDTDYAACQAVWRDNRMTTMRDYLIWYNNRDVEPFLEAIAKQATFYHDRHIDMFKDGISVPSLSLLYLFNGLPPDTNFVTFNRTNSDLHQLVKDNIVGGPAFIFHRYHEKGVTRIRGGETCRTVVGYDANALYLWALMQDMPTGWYTRRREENGFRPQQAQPFGQMAVQWFNREACEIGCTIRHQANGREKPIGKLSVDGWCADTNTAYQFHGCFWHGCPKCHTDPDEINAVNGKTMGVLLTETKKHTEYLRRHVEVVEMWECEWKEVRNESDVKTFLAPPPRQKWKMTQRQIIAAVVDGTLFGMVECDILVPSELRAHFAEMQPIFKNTTVTRDDIGPFMREYAEEHDIMSTPRRMLISSYRGDKIMLATPLLRWYLAHGLVVDRVYQVVEYHREACFRQFGESVSAARRAGDADPDKAILADTMKLLGNSAYGKTVTNVDRHRNVAYCTEVGTSSHINNKRFRQLDVVTDDAYEITSNKSRVTYDLPLHIGFFVYQYAKLRMLQFYYDFVDR